MKKQNTNKILVGTFFATALVGCASGTSSSKSAVNSSSKKIHESIIVKGVTIVNTVNGQLQANMALMIDAGKITKIIPADAVGEQGTKRVIDATGKYVVPGYMDMHAHVLDQPFAKEVSAVMLAHGITGYRQMSGTEELLKNRKDNKVVTPEDSPELLGMSGEMLTKANAPNPEAAAELVERDRKAGADFVSVGDVSPSVFNAALGESKKVGDYFAGTIPVGVDAMAAAKQGMLSMESLGPVDTLLISCSTNEDSVRKSLGGESAAPVSAEAAKLSVTNPLLVRLMANQNAFLKTRTIIDTYSDSKCKKLAETFVLQKTWQVPTLVRNQAMMMADKPQYASDSDLKYVSRQQQAYWNEVSQKFTKTVKPVAKETLRQLTAMDMMLVKLFDKQGVKMLTGTDLGGMWVVPGASLHQEFELLVKAGVTPLKVLQMTTLNGAEFLGKRSTMGTVEVGKNANLVLLDADPTDNVANLKKINAVIRDGKFYSEETLEEMKKSAAEKLASLTQPEDSGLVH
ncbi:amidohydrolase family protein [Bdellovibrio sp. HCB290]|uniref:amidohydrolase family protein n=1 Tax=Bdellovibrio sp. HCB290 TaxID=3394356 RepID=UPI0039B5A6CA